MVVGAGAVEPDGVVVSAGVIVAGGAGVVVADGVAEPGGSVSFGAVYCVGVYIGAAVPGVVTPLV
jgi:hypothetical protein